MPLPPNSSSSSLSRANEYSSAAKPDSASSSAQARALGFPLGMSVRTTCRASCAVAAKNGYAALKCGVSVPRERKFIMSTVTAAALASGMPVARRALKVASGIMASNSRLYFSNSVAAAAPPLRSAPAAFGLRAFTSSSTVRSDTWVSVNNSRAPASRSCFSDPVALPVRTNCHTSAQLPGAANCDAKLPRTWLT